MVPEGRAKVDAMAATVVRAKSSQTKLAAFWGRVEVRTQRLCIFDTHIRL